MAFYVQPQTLQIWEVTQQMGIPSFSLPLKEANQILVCLTNVAALAHITAQQRSHHATLAYGVPCSLCEQQGTLSQG